MALIQGWVLWLAAVVAIVLGLAYLVVRWPVRLPGITLAHTALLEELPRYRVLRRRYRAWSLLLALGVAALAVSGAVLGARPASVHQVRDDTPTRDVMLCLDVSDSMQDLDAAVLDRFEQLADRLRGQRIGLMIFDDGALLKFPLTDDADYVRTQLAVGARAVAGNSDADLLWLTGTIPTETSGSSHIGDGIVSCADAFDHRSEKRSRTIVLATDGEPGPHGVYTTRGSGQLVAKEGIRVYVLSRVTPQHQDADYVPSDFADLQSVATATRGKLYDASSPSAVPQIVAGIEASTATALKTPPRRVRTDDPTAFTIAALAAVGVLVLAGWRVRR